MSSEGTCTVKGDSEDAVVEAHVISLTSSAEAPLTVSVVTTTPLFHNTRCSTTANGFGSGNVACSTGLRVYEGGKMLAEFLHSDLFVGSKEGRYLRSDLHSGKRLVEIGCGCGLAGLTAALTFPDADVIFTDASADCIRLVHSSIERNMLTNSPTSRKIEGDLLWWGKSDVNCFRDKHFGGFGADVVLGSDLMYFMVDPDLLVETCKGLAQGTERSSGSGLILLSHFIRIPDGNKKLFAAARKAHLRIARVDLGSCFVNGKSELLRLGWGSLELAVLKCREEKEPCDVADIDNDYIALGEELGLPLLPYLEAAEQQGFDSALLAMEL